MAIYDIDGIELTEAYKVDGTLLDTVYDINGNSIPLEIPVTPLTWDMSENYQGQITDTLDYIAEFKQETPNSYALCQFNDVHEAFSGNEPNFIDYNKGYKVIERMLFLGDMVNWSNSSKYNLGVAFMNGASASKKLVAIGNHEYGGYSSGTASPEMKYKAVINVPCTYMRDDVLIYYDDDVNINTRFIVLNYFYITQTHADSGHKLDLNQLEWLATAMEEAGNRDVIILAHTVISPFLRLEDNKTVSSGAIIENYQDLIDLIVAFKMHNTFSITIDDETFSHDFANCTGNFVMYASGHHHALGYANFGFNMFTCPSLYQPTGSTHMGITFYIVNKSNHTIKVIQCSSQLEEPISYEYAY